MDIHDILNLVKDTKELIIGTDCISETAAVFRKFWPGATAVIIADTNTWNAAGKEVLRQLKEDGTAAGEPLIFQVPPVLHADYERVTDILSVLKQYEKAVR